MGKVAEKCPTKIDDNCIERVVGILDIYDSYKEAEKCVINSFTGSMKKNIKLI
jgi:hypothetical protein